MRQTRERGVRCKPMLHVIRGYSRQYFAASAPHAASSMPDRERRSEAGQRRAVLASTPRRVAPTSRTHRFSRGGRSDGDGLSLALRWPRRSTKRSQWSTQ